MGGNAFEPQAERLTTEQLHVLVDQYRKRLSGIFTEPIETFYFVGEKLTHGDVDLICGHIVARGGFLKGAEGGTLSREGKVLSLDFNEESLIGKKVRGEKREQEEARATKARQVCVEAARAIGAVAWKRFGNELCTKLPCDRVFPDEPSDKHYQVDMVLLPPESVAFSLFTTSYSSTLMILACALLRVTNSFVLHGGHLALRHTVYPGMTALVITLTTSPEDFCEYFGLDLARWRRGGFHTEEDVWAWMVDVSEDAVLAPVWRHMANRAEGIAPKAHKKKAEGMVRFNAWIKTTKWVRAIESPEQDDLAPKFDKLDLSLKHNEVPDQVPVSGSPSTSVQAEEKPSSPPLVVRHTDIRIMSPAHSVLTRYTTTSSGDSASTAATTISTASIPPIADPNLPNGLHPRAIKALEFFGKLQEWEKLVAEQKDEVEARFEQARIKEENRKKAREALLAAAELKEAEDGQGEGAGKLQAEKAQAVELEAPAAA